MKVQLHEAAIDDITSIFDYLTERVGHERAAEYILHIENFCRSLETFPERGRRRPDLGDDVRAIVFESRAVIAYRLEDDGVLVLRVIHGGQDYDRDAIPD